jgi:exodeoxyribonuclease III
MVHRILFIATPLVVPVVRLGMPVRPVVLPFSLFISIPSCGHGATRATGVKFPWSGRYRPAVMRVVTWNVNSIRVRHGDVMAWLRRNQPDVVLLQETKCTDAAFDELIRPELEHLGHEVAHWGRDHYNGVAIASRVGLADVRRGFPDRPSAPFDEPRLLSATCGDVRVWCVYVPNGRRREDPHWYFKLEWLCRLRDAVATDVERGVPTIVAGDVNVQRADIDVYDPTRWRNRNHATPEERAAIAAIVDVGLRDVMRERYPDPGVYTWWNYRPGQFAKNKGMRIDLVLCTGDVADRVIDVRIDREERARPVTSDHAPVVVDLAP